MENLSDSSLSGCALHFESLLSQAPLWEEPASVFPELWQNELERLKSWIVDVGADSSGMSSLEYRLRQASDMDMQIRSIASKLNAALEDLEAVLVASANLSEEHEIMTPAERDGDLIDVYQTIQTCVDALFQMTPAIMQPGGPRSSAGGRHDIEKHDRSIQQIIAGFQRDLPGCNATIRDRLAIAVHRRWTSLNYLRSTGTRSWSAGRSVFTSSPMTTESSIAVYSTPVGTTLRSPSVYHSKGSSAELQLPSMNVEQGTALSSSPMAIVNPSTAGNNPEKHTLQCSICKIQLDVSSNKEWREHVYQDVMPYVCVFANCGIPGRLHGQRLNLFDHFESEHPTELMKLNCPLCQQDQPSRQELESHIAEHLEDTAFSALRPIDAGGSAVNLQEDPDLQTQNPATQVGLLAHSEHAAMESAWRYAVDLTRHNEAFNTSSQNDPEHAAMQVAWSTATSMTSNLGGNTNEVPNQSIEPATMQGSSSSADHGQWEVAQTIMAGLQREFEQATLEAARPSLAAAQMPFSFPFSFRLKHLRGVNPTSTDFTWPPSGTLDYVTDSVTDWWVWDPETNQPKGQMQSLRSQYAPEASRYRAYRACTLVWIPGGRGYLYIPVDYTAIAATSTRYRWQSLSFLHNTQTGRADLVSIGDFGNSDWLHRPGPAYWFEELLLAAYQCPTDSSQRCTLAGHLSILVGLIAFATSSKDAVEAVDRAFRQDPSSTRFSPHQLPKPQSTY